MLKKQTGLLSYLLAAWVSLAGGLRAERSDEAWPQWRGPTRDGKVGGPAWPDSLQPEHLTLQWRVELGASYSGPIVAENRVFVTETRQDPYESVRALDRRTGAEIWRTEWEGTMKVAPLGTRMGSWIKGTPAHDGKSLYVAGMRDVLVCLDPATGRQRWRADFHARHATPLPELGFVCSPLVVGDFVYVQAADSFLCVDKNSGASVWRCLVRSEVGHGSYSSPNFGVIHGRPQLLVANIPAMAGVDLATGEVLWKRVIDSDDQGCILAPVPYRGGIFMSSRASRTAYYPLTLVAGQFTLGKGWKNPSAIYMSSPIVVGSHVYAHLKNHRLACIDMDNGQEKWISKRRFGDYCSMICRQDKILALTNDGELVLFHARPDRFEMIDTRQISANPTWGHLAMAGRQIFVRERNAIVAYQWR